MSEETPHRPTNTISSTAQSRLYRIELRGRVDQGWLTGCDLAAYSSSDRLTMIVVLADQAALRGILNRLWDLNLDILSVSETAGPAVRNGGK